MTKIQSLEKKVKELQKEVEVLKSRPQTIIHYHYSGYPVPVYIEYPRQTEPYIWCDSVTTSSSTDTYIINDNVQWSYTKGE